MLLALALVSDLTTFRIKNSITYGFMTAGLLLNTATGGLSGLVDSLQGIMLPVICLIALYMLRIIGAGDIKLLSALGAIMGAGFAIYAAIYSFICGGFIAAVLLVARDSGVERLKYIMTYMKGCLLSGGLLQYTDFSNRQESGRFHFSIAVASGAAAAYLVPLITRAAG